MHSQINESIYKPDRKELEMTYDRFQEYSGRPPFIDFRTRVKITLIWDIYRHNVLEN